MKYVECIEWAKKVNTDWAERDSFRYATAKQFDKMVADGILETRKVSKATRNSFFPSVIEYRVK